MGENIEFLGDQTDIVEQQLKRVEKEFSKKGLQTFFIIASESSVLS